MAALGCFVRKSSDCGSAHAQQYSDFEGGTQGCYKVFHFTLFFFRVKGITRYSTLRSSCYSRSLKIESETQHEHASASPGNKDHDSALKKGDFFG